MKYLFIIAVALFFGTVVSAQTKNPTNTKEIQDKINQAQQQLDKLSPEQKKMMEKMGMSTKAPTMPKGITDADVNAAVNGNGFGVPAKNATLLGAIPKITLTATMIPAYIKSVNEFINKGIAGDAKFTVENAYTYYKNNHTTPQMMGNVAMGFWSMGYPDIAVYMAGKVCADDVANNELLSNFAAMLSMSGAPHKAIPLLEYLSKLYPENTTIHNNLGQAWFYMGETEKANVQLDKVVKAFAYHPQANYTQCLIQQSKGNTAQAIEKMKNSLAYSYSPDKVNMLRKLGYKVKGTDMRIPFRPDPNPLGLRNFKRPDVPTSYADELRLRADWDAFNKQLIEKTTQLSKDLIPAQQANALKAQQLARQFTSKEAVMNTKASAATADNLYRAVAEKNLEEMKKDGGTAFRLKKAKAKIDELRNDFAAKEEAGKKRIEKENSIVANQESELAKKGENIGFDNCVVQEKYSAWVYATYNKPLEEAYQNYLHQMYLKIAEELYWKQFTQDAATFEATKIAAKKEWLAALENTRYIPTNKYGNCPAEEKKVSKFKLADFDDMHCAYKSSLKFPGIGTQTFECGRSSVEFEIGKLSGNFHFKFDDKGKNRFEYGGMEATVIDKSISIKNGPLQVGAKVKAGVGVEFTSKGITDVYAMGEASVNLKSNIVDQLEKDMAQANNSGKDQPGLGDIGASDQGVEVGVEGRMSLISGNSSTNVFVNTPK